MIWNQLANLMADNPQSSYVVGGFLRDIYLGRRPDDLDLVTAGSAVELGRQLAEGLGGSFIMLDAERSICRIVLPRTQDLRTFRQLDIAPLQGDTLETDVRGRDLTINALALSLNGETFSLLAQLTCSAYGCEEWERARLSLLQHIIDHVGGLADLKDGVIRVQSGWVLKQDALRVLRALRFAAELSWPLAAASRPLLAEAAPGLTQVAGERIRDEVFALLDCPASAAAFREGMALGVLQYIWPEAAKMQATEQNHHHVVNVWEHCLAALEVLEKWLQGANKLPQDIQGPMVGMLAERIGRTERTYGQLLKWVALFHDVGKITTQGLRADGRITFYGHDAAGKSLITAMAARMALSNKEAQWAGKLTAMHMRPLMLYNAKGAGVQARVRMFRDLGEEALAVLLLSLADMGSKAALRGSDNEEEGYHSFIFQLCREYLAQPDHIFPPSLISGADVVKCCPGIPKAKIGGLLEAVRDKQGEGKLKTRDEALVWLSKQDK